MKSKLIKLIVILAITIGILKMIDEENYMRTKPLIKSLRIYNEKNTDTYYLVYKFDKYMNKLEGSTIYLHGRPIDSEVKLLPENRQKHKFDNWDFNLNNLEENIYVRSINSKAKKYISLNFGIYRLGDNTLLKGKDRRAGTIKNIDLDRSAIVDQLDISNLPNTELTYNKKELMNFGYYKKMEISPVNLGIILAVLLAMSACIVNYIENIYKGEYSSKKDIPKLITLVIAGLFPLLIFIKSGALSTVIDVLWGLLILSLIINRGLDKNKIKLYITLILMLSWWYYTTKIGINSKEGLKVYEGLVKSFVLPLLFLSIDLNWDKIKKISVIYLLSCITYLMYFKDKLTLNRFGEGIFEGQRLAQILAFVILSSLVYLIYGEIKKSYRIILSGIILFALPFVIVSGVRGVWVGLFPLMLLIITYKYRKMSAVALVVLALFSFNKKMDTNNSLIKRVKSIANIEEDRSNRQRVRMIEFAIGEIVKNPLKGIGLEGFRKNTSTSQELLDRKSELEVKLQNKESEKNKIKFKRELSDTNYLLSGPEHSHNSYLETLVSTGIPGFLLYAVLIILIFIRLFKKFINLKDKNEKLIFISFAFIFICHIIYNMTDYGFGMSKPQQSIWFAIALLLNYKGKTDNEMIVEKN